jgi:predicted Rossmann fold nucleotide-binding protein DprA/Smf involved in DNA uptake
VLTDTAEAILLLTARFPGSQTGGYPPLGPVEYGCFAAWLHSRQLMPEHLLSSTAANVLEEYKDKKVTPDRIRFLLQRGAALGFSLEKWERSGIWILTRADEDYPVRLKKKLGFQAPPVIYGYGNRKLLKTPSLAVVGSRNVSTEDLMFSHKLGEQASVQGFSIVSGGAKGIDQAAMLGALESEGTAVGFLADSLMKASMSKKYRSHLMDNNLALVSTFSPESTFNVGNAMQRNKYIYCSSDLSIVVHSGLSGGTWTGAIENIKNRWVPLFIKENCDQNAGNASLISMGGAPLACSIEQLNFMELTSEQDSPAKTETKCEEMGQLDLFAGEKSENYSL